MAIRLTAFSQTPADFYEVIPAEQPGRMYEKSGSVLYRAAAGLEKPAALPQELTFESALRTELLSEAGVLLKDQSHLRLRQLTRLQILRRQPTSTEPVVKLLDGQIRVSSRGKSISVPVETRFASATPRGTEYTIGFDEKSGRTEVTMFDGLVTLSNEIGSIEVTNGWQAIADPGQAPRKARIGTVKVVQWWIDYPGVLDADELVLPPTEQNELTDSLLAYRHGDLGKALQLYPGYPNPSEPKSEAGRVYLAGLLLGMGAVDQAEAQLNGTDRNLPTARALKTMIYAVTPDLEHLEKHRTPPATLLAHPSATASEWLAESYWHQSTNNLVEALACARRAVRLSPQFGFGWARVGELEFSFGRTVRAQAAANYALRFSPRNAEAHALKGFLLAAQNQVREAIAVFDEAISIDSSLGNAWLGRGLCKRRLGQKDWLEDIQAAAGLEPGRALFRSYLGKAYAEAGDSRLSEKELNYAHVSDPNDPTSWLYSALLKQQQNRINEGIGDLEKSQTLNDNRALFRSEMLLDQDKAVRSANLAGMYRDAGMGDVGVREAARAVTCDYANDSAHLFLSDSFNELRDPTRFNLRQETVWFNELLLANLLSPVGAGRLSQTVTANEYSKLFEADGVGLASQTSWRSDEQFRQLASQYGTSGNSSWAFDVDYQHNAGVRPNNELDRLEWYTTIKHQITPQDTLLLLAKYQDYHSGDNFQYYDPKAVILTTNILGNVSTNPVYRPNFKFEEHQEPILIGGFQHQWAPGVRTLLLGGRLVNEQKFSDRQANQLLLFEDGTGAVVATEEQPFDVQLTDRLEIYTAELNQIVQQDRFSLVAGAQWQGGDFEFANSLANPPLPPFFLPPVSASFKESFDRFKAYGYLTVEPLEKLWLTAGVAYDQMTMPANFRSLPQSAGTEDRDLLGPKAALVWSPCDACTLRSIYAKSLGGVSLDESFRLEPTQLAGFAQSFRTVISESIAGSVAAPESEVLGLATDFKFGPRTFVGVQVERITSEVERSIGVFRLANGLAPYAPSTTRELLDYEELTFSISLNHRLGNGFSLGANYRVTKAELQSTLPEIPAAVRVESAYLHQIGGYLLYNHDSGFFARFDARYYQQSNRGYTTALPGDEFMQLDLQVGYRLWRRRAELSIGILNLTDQDYRLNPLTIYQEMPRERVFAARFSFRF